MSEKTLISFKTTHGSYKLKDIKSFEWEDILSLLGNMNSSQKLIVVCFIYSMTQANKKKIECETTRSFLNLVMTLSHEMIEELSKGND